MNFQDNNLNVAELAARLADDGHRVVLVNSAGNPYSRTWQTEGALTAFQLQKQLKSWRDAQIRIVRDGKLVDPFARVADEATETPAGAAWEPPAPAGVPEAEAAAGGTRFRIPHPSEPQANAVAALRLFSLEHSAIPLIGKAPRVEGWQDAPDRMAFMKEHLKADGNIGIVCGAEVSSGLHIVGGDFDFTNVAASNAARDILAGMMARYGKNPKFLTPFLVNEADSHSRDFKWVRGTGEEITLQILGQSASKGAKQFVAWGVHPDTEKPYEWQPDSDGRTIFDLRPNQLPVVSVADLLARLGEALKASGWSRKAKAEPGAQAAPDDTLGALAEDEKRYLLDWARKLLAEACAKLADMGVGTGRGAFVFELMLKIGPLIGAGALSRDDAQGMIAEATIFADVERDFTRALATPVNTKTNWSIIELKRYRAFAPGRAPGGTGAGSAGGQSFKDFLKEAEANKEGDVMALEMHRSSVDVCNVLMTPDSVINASWIAEAGTRAMRGRVYRSTGGNIVIVTRQAGHIEGSDISYGKEFDYLSLPPSRIGITVLDDKAIAFQLARSGVFWYPRSIPENAGVVYSPDGDVVSWQEMKGIIPITIRARTEKWARRRGLNSSVLDDRRLDLGGKVWVSGKGPCANVLAHAAKDFRGGNVMATMNRLQRVVSAPTMGPGGQIIAKEGATQVTNGVFIEAALGPLKGLVNIPSDEVLQHPIDGKAALSAAVAEIDAFLDLYPTDETLDRSVFCAYVLAHASRAAFPLCPATGFDAGEINSGKTYAAVSGATIMGAVVSVVTSPVQGDGAKDEIGKSVSAVLIADGADTIVVDEVPGGKIPNVGNIKTLLTAQGAAVELRILGKSEMVRVSAERLIMAFTGVSLNISDDMTRRMMRCRLSLRKARIRGWRRPEAAAKLGELFTSPEKLARFQSAVLTALRYNWIVRPCKLPPTSNYAGWSATVREAAMLVTGVDPWTSTEEIKASDTSAARDAEILGAIVTLMGAGAELTASGVVSAVKEREKAASSFNPRDETPEDKARGLLTEAFNMHVGQHSALIRVGGWLSRHCNHALLTNGGWMEITRLERRAKHKGEPQRFVVKVIAAEEMADD